MKVTINIDCTPQEARNFFGLPDVEPFQKAAMAELEKRMKEHMANMTDPEAVMKTWISLSGQSMEHVQKFFAAAMSGSGSGGKR